MGKVKAFLRRSAPLLLLLFYPFLAWLLAAASSPDELPSEVPHNLALWVIRSVYVQIAIGFGFCLTVSLLASSYRARPKLLPHAFNRGLYATFALLAILIPAEGLVLAVALYLAGPKELWFWSIFVLGGAVVGTVVLLTSGLRERPEVCSTLRASRVTLLDHPKLERMLSELSADLQVPLPSNILVGFQPATMALAGTVFCPDGELKDGVLCLSLPASKVLSIPEFRALVGEAIMELHLWRIEDRKEFMATAAGAHDVLTNLKLSMEAWSWKPKWGLHPFFVIVWLALVASMRLPLYLGKEVVTFYVDEFWSTRRITDIDDMVQAHRSSTADVGTVPAISGLIKEATLSLYTRYALFHEKEAKHALGTVAMQIYQEHPNLRIANDPCPWRDPISAWQHLQLRCRISGTSLEWCRQIALDVNPSPSAVTLFQDSAKLEDHLVTLYQNPFVMAGHP